MTLWQNSLVALPVIKTTAYDNRSIGDPDTQPLREIM
jgi:hypothetical protein